MFTIFSNSFLDPKILSSLNLISLISRHSLPPTIIVFVSALILIIYKGFSLEILDSETGISPGQACVFYSKDDLGDKVLGGGWIHKTYNKNLST
mgnify:CR=1 FL=1